MLKHHQEEQIFVSGTCCDNFSGDCVLSGIFWNTLQNTCNKIVIIRLFMFTSSNFYCTYLVLWIIRIKRCIFTLKCLFNFVKLKYFNQQFNNLYLEDVSRDYTAMVNILKYSKFLVTGWGRAFQIK